MKTILLASIFSAFIFWSGSSLAQEIFHQTNTEQSVKKAEIATSGNRLLVSASKTMQKPEAEKLSPQKTIKVLVTIPGEKITAVNETRDETKKGGLNEN